MSRDLEADLDLSLDCVIAAFLLALAIGLWESAEVWADRAFRLVEDVRAP